MEDSPPSIRIGHLDFSLVGALEPDRGTDGVPLEFTPHKQYTKAATGRLHRYGLGPFCRLRVGQGIRHAGLYAVLCAGEVRYVGICQNLAERWGPRGYGVIHPRNCYAGG